MGMDRSFVALTPSEHGVGMSMAMELPKQEIPKNGDDFNRLRLCAFGGPPCVCTLARDISSSFRSTMEGRFRYPLPSNPKARTQTQTQTQTKTRRSHRLRNRILTLRHVLGQNTDEFCRSTTLHGLKYVANQELHPFERVFFAVSFVAVLVVSGFYILQVYSKWAKTPVILGINPEPTFIADEPFPAVTICNLNQALRSRATAYSQYSTQHAMLQILCKRTFNQTVASSITDWTELERFIPMVSQPCAQMVVTCRFGAVDYNCSDIFHPIITDEGLCCVFNMVHPQFMYAPNVQPPVNVSTPPGFVAIDWYAEKGYPSVRPPLYTPQTAAGTGESLGLSIALNVEFDEYYCSSSNSVGFKIALHSPNESPNVRDTGLLLAPGKETKIRIQPEKTMTDDDLRRIDIKYRHCLFHDERQLLYFAHYTQRNCEMECLARLLMHHCGCIGFYMPKVYENVTICNVDKMACLEMVRLKTSPTVENCLDTCLPSCFDLTFLADFFWTPVAHKGFSIVNEVVNNFSHEYVVKNIAVVNMYFKENTFRSSIQTEFIGFSDFLSSVGGLMGLFLGFSFISIVEFIYFGFLRPYRTFVERRARSNTVRLSAQWAANGTAIKAPGLPQAPARDGRRPLRKRYCEQLKRYDHIQYPRFHVHEIIPYGRGQINGDLLQSISNSIGNARNSYMHSKA